MSKDNNSKWYKKWWGITLIVLGVFLIIGIITSGSGNNPNSTIGNDPLPDEKLNEPLYLSDFDSVLEKDLVRFYLQVKDINGKVLKAPGQLEYSISCSIGADRNIMYSNTINVSSKDYKMYENKMSGTELGNYYEFYVPVSNMNSIKCPRLLAGFSDGETRINLKFNNIDSNLDFTIYED